MTPPTVPPASSCQNEGITTESSTPPECPQAIRGIQEIGTSWCMDIQTNRSKKRQGGAIGYHLIIFLWHIHTIQECAALLLLLGQLAIGPTRRCSWREPLAITPHVPFRELSLFHRLGTAAARREEVGANAVLDSLPPRSLVHTAAAITTSWHFCQLRAQTLFPVCFNFGDSVHACTDRLRRENPWDTHYRPHVLLDLPQCAKCGFIVLTTSMQLL